MDSWTCPAPARDIQGCGPHWPPPLTFAQPRPLHTVGAQGVLGKWMNEVGSGGVPHGKSKGNRPRRRRAVGGACVLPELRGTGQARGAPARTPIPPTAPAPDCLWVRGLRADFGRSGDCAASSLPPALADRLCAVGSPPQGGSRRLVVLVTVCARVPPAAHREPESLCSPSCCGKNGAFPQRSSGPQPRQLRKELGP